MMVLPCWNRRGVADAGEPHDVHTAVNTEERSPAVGATAGTSEQRPRDRGYSPVPEQEVRR